MLNFSSLFVIIACTVGFAASSSLRKVGDALLSSSTNFGVWPFPDEAEELEQHNRQLGHCTCLEYVYLNETGGLYDFGLQDIADDTSCSGNYNEQTGTAGDSNDYSASYQFLCEG